MFAVLFVAAAAVGDERLNLFGFFITTFVLVRRNQGVNIANAILFTYFATKAFFFIVNIVEIGNGYAT